jgi:dethiobiotin synthetase
MTGRGLPRPATLAVVVGTGTEVGKTWVTVRLAGLLRAAGVAVWARKPAQSFAADDPTTDADLLAAATGEDPEVVCPSRHRYPVPMAPPMAAEALGRPQPTIADLVAATGWDPVPGSAAVRGVGLVETAGGLRSPQGTGRDADGLALVGALHPDLVVLVADAGLGTINSLRLTVPLLAPWPLTVVLNGFDPADPLHAANRRVVADDLATAPTAAGTPALVTTVEDLAARVSQIARIATAGPVAEAGPVGALPSDRAILGS